MFKSVLFLLFALIGLVVTAWGQPEGGRRFSSEDRVERQLTAMKDRLDLSEEQSETIQGILEKYVQEMEDFRETNQGDREEMRIKMRSVNKEQNKEIKAVLTEEQLPIYEEMRKEQGERMRERRRNRRENQE